MGDYSRQLAFLGKKGQQKLERASAAIVGCGGLGSHVAVQLARSGVGKLLLIDPDNVERSNLHRVMIFTEKDIGKPKAKTLSEKLRKAVGSVEVDYKIEKLGKENTDILINSGLDRGGGKGLLQSHARGGLSPNAKRDFAGLDIQQSLLDIDGGRCALSCGNHRLIIARVERAHNVETVHRGLEVVIDLVLEIAIVLLERQSFQIVVVQVESKIR